LTCNHRIQTKKPDAGLEGCPYAKNNQQKNGSDHATSEPLFILRLLFGVFPVHLLTLLLIGVGSKI
jgi:hypothetical protein